MISRVNTDNSLIQTAKINDTLGPKSSIKTYHGDEFKSESVLDDSIKMANVTESISPDASRDLMSLQPNLNDNRDANSMLKNAHVESEMSFKRKIMKSAKDDQQSEPILQTNTK